MIFLRLLIFLPAILTPACKSPSLAFRILLSIHTSTRPSLTDTGIHERCSLVHLHQFTPLTWSQASPPWRMLQKRPRVTVPTQPERSRECVSRSSGGTESHGNQTRQQRPLAGGPQRWDRCAPAWQLPLRGVHLSVTHLLKPLLAGLLYCAQKHQREA